VDGSLRRALIDALGAEAVLDGGAVLAPAAEEGVEAALRIAAEHALPLRLTSAEPPRGRASKGGATLSLHRLTRLSVDVGNGVAEAQAGVTVEALRSELAAQGVTLPGLPSSPRSRHVGSLVARGEMPRRALTGVEVVLPGGDRLRFGAAVLKDVVGYDLTGAILGSEGRLAAMTGAWLRLVPAGASPPVGEAAGSGPVGEITGAFDPQGILAGM
jgi:glycolate oxidase